MPQTVTDPVTGLPVPAAGTSITITAFATADHSKYAVYGPMPVTAAITMSITQPLPATMLTGATAQVIAVVSNDTTNAGVTWQVNCPLSTGPCGSITPTTTASGVAATYTAPATVPSPNPAPGLTVTIFAFANATGSPNNPTSTLNVSTTVNIVAPISVSITQNVKNNTIVANHTASLVATVSNDYTNAGVDWTVSCGSPGAGACGTFSPAHTASGAATTYTAPSAPPTGNTVTITATSTADPTKTDQQIVTVTGAPLPNSLLSGPFVLYLSAKNSQNGPFVFGGVLSGDGNGNVSGQFDVADAAGNAAGSNSFRTVSPSTYNLGSDGRGHITLTLNTGVLAPKTFGVPVPGSSTTSTLTLSVVFVTPQHALLTETDSFGDAAGTLDLQNATDLASFQSHAAGLNGTYSLQLTGTGLGGSGHPSSAIFLAAAITSQASSFTYTFTGFTTDQSVNGAVASVPFTAGSQSFQVFPNASTGEIQLSGVNLGLPSPYSTFSPDLWLIDKDHFVVTDFADAVNAVFFAGGYLTAQPASPSLSGTFAFTEAGATTAASAPTPGQPQVAGGILTCGSTGSVDVVPLSGTAVTNQAVSATCSAPSNGRSLS